MAKITIENFRHLPEFSPLLCMRCGQEVDDFYPVRFTQANERPFLSLLLILAGPIGHLALLLIPKETMSCRLEMPICTRHKNHWQKNKLYLSGAVLLLVILILVLAINVQAQFLPALSDFFILFATLIGIYAAFLYWLSHQKIACAKITKYKIILTGIHPAYATEFNRMQGEFLEAFEKWKLEEQRKRSVTTNAIRERDEELDD